VFLGVPAKPTAAAALCLGLTACTPSGQPVDLLKGTEERLVEASVAGRDRDWVSRQAGKHFRIRDVVYRTLPAAPPSRLRFRLTAPSNGRLTLACAVAPKYHEQPGVEFVVSVARNGSEETVWTRLLDPISNPEDRGWVTAQVDLSHHAGREIGLILETRGFEEADDPRRAFWGAPAVIAQDRPAPLVILYLVDTLRADHTTPYGYERNTTPELLELARDAVVFETPIVHASWTRPSVASIFTSLLPGRHRAVQLRDPLDPGFVTLAEMLESRGYATGAAIANSVIYSDGTYFEQGFDFYAGLHGAGDRPSKLVDAADVVDAALAWVDARRGLPNFVYIHTMDPHVPYAPPEPFNRMFEPHPKPGHPGVDPRSDYKEPLDRERLVAQYDGSIAYGDRELGRFIDELKRRGVYEQALIVFTADHGEEFLDHGKWLHGRSVFDELVRVPLIVKFPGNEHAGRRIAQQVQAVDLLPTILENEGLPVPPPPVITGHPLQRTLEGRAPERAAVSEISHRGIVAHGMRTSRDKYVRSFSPEEYEAYFNLVEDPKEQSNLFDESARRVRNLRAGLEAAMVINPFRHVLRFVGDGDYSVLLRTGGWIEGVEGQGFEPSERLEVQASGRKLAIAVKLREGQSRQVELSVRPMGAPLRLEGTRDGRPLRPRDVLIAEQAVHPVAVPFELPEIESESERVENIFAPPPNDRSGIHVWLSLTPGREVMDFDEATRERLKALGYLGN